MSEYPHVEKPFLDQLATLGWTVIDQGHGFIPSDPAASPTAMAILLSAERSC